VEARNVQFEVGEMFPGNLEEVGQEADKVGISPGAVDQTDFAEDDGLQRGRFELELRRGPLDAEEGIAEAFADLTGPESGPWVEKGETNKLMTWMCCDKEIVLGSDAELRHGGAGWSAHRE
jgi:hypothetical protein